MGRRELSAITITLAVGLPLMYLFGQAVIDGTARMREAPVIAVLGPEMYGRLMAGERTPQHYLGRDRLAPDFTLDDHRGRPWRLSDRRGRVVVLNFWTITCQPCIREMPTLDTLAGIADEDWGDVDVVAVSTDRGYEEVATVLPAEPKLTLLFDPDKSTVTGRYGTDLYPETWIIDRQGVIRFRYDGALDWSNAVVLDVIDSFR